MTHRVLIFDTSVLCCWLRVPGKETAGNSKDSLTPEQVDRLIEEETARGSFLMLPMASLIETGNHIAQAPSRRYECACALSMLLEAAADGRSPWTAFAEQSELWEPARLRKLAKDWPNLASSRMSIGDATIKNVAEYYNKLDYDVQILTADAGLKAYEPLPRAKRHRRSG